jgi:8-hydroxy-5-deazaflavin:NADPH oxidoreductase
MQASAQPDQIVGQKGPRQMALSPNEVRTVGFIGAGKIGSALARHFVATGRQVVLSNSRDPRTLDGLVSELGEPARAATPAEAAAAGDVVVVAVPVKAYPSMPVDPLAGKVVLDTGNYYPARDGQIPELDEESSTSTELLQRHLPSSDVVKAFNAITAKHLATQAQPPGTEGRRALPIAGDDRDAKDLVTSLVDQIGFDVVDVGPLTQGWRFQPRTWAYLVPLTTGELSEALARARRYRDLTPDEAQEIDRRSREARGA